jgi:DNA invertase Pin-like site-specific DNA recombinase
MFTESSQKVTASHLQRDAFLYVRQSSLRQVLENTESTQRQYALQERAVALGWPAGRIHVIDSDQGRSGSQSAGRDGFQQLVTEVALGHAGIVLGLEVSRLARNNADWHRLLELSALTGTLILDEDGIYDPIQFNDRLLLGLKGTMSEAELHVLKARLQGGILNKARRGELEMAPPIGFIQSEDGTLKLDPDRQIQATLRLLFETFRQRGSAMAVVKRFQAEGWQFPRHIRSGIGKGDLAWGSLNHSRAIQILHNPRYAGTFVYGRTRSVCNAQMQKVARKLPRSEWRVVIHGVHEGYIDWDEFERNQATLAANMLSFAGDIGSKRPREGPALLQGRVVCGHCGSPMRVRYQEVGNRLEPYYHCDRDVVRNGAKQRCQSVRGSAIDQAIGALLRDAVSSAAVAACLSVQDEIAQRVGESEALRAAQLERARYEAELSRRRYLKVDPDHRLVADTLEAEWNERLRQLQAMQQDHDRQRERDQALLALDAREKVRNLVADFRRVWDDPETNALERKRMAALLIEDVTLAKREDIAVQVRFRGGGTASLQVGLPLPIAKIRKTRPEVVQALDGLLESLTDREAAVQLNALGFCNWKGEPFTTKKVILVRQAYHLTSRFQRLSAQGYVSGGELAAQLSVSTTTIHQWGRDGLLQRALYGNNKRCLYLPLPPSVTIIKGKAARGHSTPAHLSIVQSTAQEIV